MDPFERFLLEAPSGPTVGQPPEITKPQSQQQQAAQPPAGQQQGAGQDQLQGPGEDPTAAAGGENPNATGADQGAGAEDQQGAEAGAEGGEGEEGAADQGGTGEEMPPEEPPTIQDQLKQDEQEIFKDLSPQQIQIKIKELKDKYSTLITDINKTLTNLNKVSHTTFDDTTLDFVVKKLMELKDICKDSLLYTFDTRTYIENQVHLQKILVTYNIIGNMITNVDKVRAKHRLEFEKKNKINNNSGSNDFPFIITKGIDLQ